MGNTARQLSSSKERELVGKVAVPASHNQSGLAFQRMSALVFVAFALFPVVRWEPAPIDLLGPSIAALLGFNIIRSQRAFVVNRAFVVGLYLMVLIGSLTIHLSPNPLVSLRYHGITCLVIILSIACHLVTQDPQLVRVALRSLILGSGALVLVTLVAYLSGLNLTGVSSSNLRYVALSKNPNALGVLLSVPLAIVASELQVKSRYTITNLGPRLLMALTALYGFAVFVTFSRNALIVMAITLTCSYGISLTNRTVSRRSGSILFFPVGVFAVAVLAYRFAPAQGLEYLLGKMEEVDSDNPRLLHQLEVLSNVLEHPILGQGPLSGALQFGLGAHNAYVTQLHDYGLLGFIILMCLIIPPLLYSLRIALTLNDTLASRVALIIASALLGQLFAGLLMDFIHQRQLWMLIGMGWALPVLVKTEKQTALAVASQERTTS